MSDWSPPPTPSDPNRGWEPPTQPLPSTTHNSWPTVAGQDVQFQTQLLERGYNFHRVGPQTLPDNKHLAAPGVGESN